MYKTVRKGDASLQYTILPQTDQFSSGGFSPPGKSRPRIIKYIMGTLMILIILSCVATPFLMNQYDRNLFASTMLAIGRVGYSTTVKNTSRSQTKDFNENRSRNKVPSITMPTAEQLPRRKNIAESTNPISSGISRVNEQDYNEEYPKDIVILSTQSSHTVAEITIADQVSTFSATSSTPATIPSRPASEESTVNSRTVTNTPKKTKMPRVTLKLRKNETIPKMYMQAGIASYKKGNITTSVLAHDLSLEGLIFKTPEGTIKPWPQKWLFSDPASDFQWKGPNPMPLTIYVILASLAALASISIILMFYVQRKASRRQRQNIEEPELEGHDEDQSTLLGHADGKETEDKE